MSFSRREDMIWREVKALSGDLDQVADNIERDLDERVKQAEESKKAKPGALAPMRGFDLPAFSKDLSFIKDRLELLLVYIFPPKE